MFFISSTINPFHVHGFKSSLQMEGQMERRNRKWLWLVLKKRKRKKKVKLKGLERKSVGTVTSIRYAWAVDVFSLRRVKAQQDVPGWFVYFSLSFPCPLFQHSWEPLNKPRYVPALYGTSTSIPENHEMITVHHGLLHGGDSTIWIPRCSCCSISITLEERQAPECWNCSRIAKVPKWLQESIAHLKWCVSLSAGVRLLKAVSSIGFFLRIDGADLATEHYHVICLVSISSPTASN